MKKILFCLLSVCTFSTFAAPECQYSCSEKQTGSILQEVVAAVASAPANANQVEAYTRTCVVTSPDGTVFSTHKISGIETTGFQSQGHASKRDSKPSRKQRRIQKQRNLVLNKIMECNQSLNF